MVVWRFDWSRAFNSSAWDGGLCILGGLPEPAGVGGAPGDYRSGWSRGWTLGGFGLLGVVARKKPVRDAAFTPERMQTGLGCCGLCGSTRPSERLQGGSPRTG